MKDERLLPRGSEEIRALIGGVPRAFVCCEAINRLPYAEQDAIRGAWSELTGQPTNERFRLVPPIHSDHGLKLRIGANVFINHGCTLNDMGGIEIGEDTMIGPNVSLLTSGHPTAVADRRAGITVAPIHIGDNVWIGAGATVLGGVTVGDGAVVAAGAVVSRDVPPATLVAGCPHEQSARWPDRSACGTLRFGWPCLGRTGNRRAAAVWPLLSPRFGRMQFGLVDLTDPRLSGLVAESRAFYAQRVAGRGPNSLEELRRFRATAPAPAPSDPPAAVEVVRACGRSVPVRIHEPASGEVAGVFLEIHGGGFYMGSAAGSDVRDRALADALDLAVVSVDYRLAPEHPWPAAPDDCETAALWLADHAQDRFGTTKLFIGGFSAGATLAMSTLLRLREWPVAAYGTAVLQFGTYDLSGLTPAGRLIADEYFLDAYAGAAEDRTHPDISPIYADLVGLPPVLIVVGADDVLLQDNLAMAGRLSAAGVDVELRIYPASPHGFTGHGTPMATAAMDDIKTWLRRRHR